MVQPAIILTSVILSHAGVVVPTLYALIEEAKHKLSTGYARTRNFFLEEPESDTVN